jgi:hypothetical protein
MAELLGVELARPGIWQLSSGPREFTSQMLRDAADFFAASGSQRVPLGFGHMDRRFDGDPAFGWLSNVRYVDGDTGPVLLGDLVDLEDWVAAAAPSRWPNRSVEGVAGVTFNGREYGLALTRVALLGATPPGIPVLKSLSDLRQLVAASVAASGGEWIAASLETSPQGAEHPSDREGAVGMPDAAKLREALGLAADASDDEVKTALASAGLGVSQTEPPKPAPNLPAPAPEPVPEPAPERAPELVAASAAPGGATIVLASSVYEEMQKTMKGLTSFVEKTKRDERDAVIAKGVQDGKFTPAQKPQFARLWDADPDGTRKLIEETLTRNSAFAVMASGYDSGDDEAIDREYAHLFPPSYDRKEA